MNMIDALPDLAEFFMTWAAAGGTGFYIHKKVAIDYKQRWKDAVETLKAEQLNTAELEEAKPKPEPKPSNVFEPAGNADEFRHIPVKDRLKMERERLANGLPPKDSMIGTNLYSLIATDRVKLGWDWHTVDGGWYFRPTKTQAEREREQRAAIDHAYKKGKSEGHKEVMASVNYPSSYHHYSSDYREWDYYKKKMGIRY